MRDSRDFLRDFSDFWNAWDSRDFQESFKTFLSTFFIDFWKTDFCETFVRPLAKPFERLSGLLRLLRDFWDFWKTWFDRFLLDLSETFGETFWEIFRTSQGLDSVETYQETSYSFKIFEASQTCCQVFKDPRIYQWPIL